MALALMLVKSIRAVALQDSGNELASLMLN